MTAELWLVDAVNGAPEYDGKSGRQMFGFGPAPVGRPLGAVSGVWPGTTSSIVTVTATTWTVGAHRGQIDKLPAVDQGAYRYALPLKSGDVTAADATNARVDRVDVQITAGDGETTHDSIDVVYTAGTPSANPVAPVAPDNSFPLAEIQMPKAGGGDPTFTWKAPIAGTPDWQDLTLAGNLVAAGGKAQYGIGADGRVWLRGTAKHSDGSDLSSTAVLATMPKDYRPSVQQEFPVATANDIDVARIEVQRDGDLVLWCGTNTTAWLALDGIGYWL